VLAEQVAEALEFAEQPLVFGDYCPAAHAAYHLLLQPQLVGKQLPRRRAGITSGPFEPAS
jgi:hypothetical protein